MPSKHEVYKCTHCGNVVEVLTGGKAPLVCCGEPMKLMREGQTDGAKEKHVPVIEKTENGYRVKVGSDPHAMTDAHWIEWIELVVDGVSYRKFLKPGDEPVAEFCVSSSSDKVVAREYCNLHGLWKAEL